MSYLFRYFVLPTVAMKLLVACATTRVEPPSFVNPVTQFKEGGIWQQASTVAPVPEDWWTLFEDPILDELQQHLIIGNENLKSAVAAVTKARSVYEASQSAMLPTLSAGFVAARSGNQTTSATANAQNPGNSLSLSAMANWEIDLWGRLSQASVGAEASWQASLNDLAAARLSAQALLTQTYFSLRAADAQLSLLERSVESYQRSLDLTQTRYEAGVASRTDTLQAQTQLKTVEIQLAEVSAQRAQLEHAIAVLLGVAPSVFGIDRRKTASSGLPLVPIPPKILPSTLLERRPDIAAAQQRVVAAYAQIGVANAAFFPDLSLSANAGYRSSSLANLVSMPNLLWSLGPSLTQAIFDGGQRKLASAQARASADQATSAYRQTVLAAFQEVEDSLALAEQLEREAQLQGEALQAAQRNLEITFDQYRSGTVSYLNVVIAQTATLASESSLLNVRNRQLAATNLLLKNTAGRWP